MSKKHDEIEMTKEEKKAYKKLQEKFELVPKQEKIRTKNELPDKQNVLSNAISIIKQPAYTKRLIMVAVIFGLIYSFLYGIWRIPVIEFGINRMSEVGIVDYTYLFLISLLTGAILSLSKFEKTQNIKSTKIGGGGGFIAAVFAGICPVCQGIQILALGSTIVSIPLAFIVPYIGLIQILTLFILGFALYLKSNSIYTKTCVSCVAPSKKNIFNFARQN